MKPLFVGRRFMPGTTTSTGYLTTYDLGFLAGSANREDLLDLITNIDPWDTPFFSSAPKVQANHVTHEWITDTLNATSIAGAGEGTDFGVDTMTQRSRRRNVCQIFRKDIAVSDTQRAVNPAGVRDEYEYQIMKAMRELARNIEATIFQLPGGQSASGAEGSSASARQMGGLRASALFAIPSLGSGSASASTALVNTIHETVYTLGGNPDTMYLSPGMKSDFTASCYASGIGGKSYNIALSDRKLINNIDVYESDFGLLAVVPDRFVPQSANSADGNAFFLVERAKARIATLRPIRHVPIGKGGDSTRGFVVGELTLEVLHPSAHGIVSALIT